MSENPLRQLKRLGQSVWFDYIRRWEMSSGHLKQLIDEDGLSGVTSNPSIFEKAVSGSNDYDEAIRKLAAEGKDVPQIFETLAVEDIQNAADLFLPVYTATDGRDGYVSIEVSPLLAHDTAATIEDARRLSRAVNRPNVLVKVPGTVEGLPAIEQLLGEGININITLLFSVERYVQVANAYVSALEKLAREGKPLKRAASVASFFVSRIDTLVDQQLDAKLRVAGTDAERERIQALFGKTAIANAKLAYQQFKQLFGGARFQALAGKGARVQRLLWASTGTKNPKYSDLKYVEELIGPCTINTLPVKTIKAYLDHGKPKVKIDFHIEQSEWVMEQLSNIGIDIDRVTQQLEDEGIDKFNKPFDKLLATLEKKMAEIKKGE